ncbi:hypothetical protein BGZ72_009473 [Mortierella alpina]|nr:hypothetical protein BGZ72_009473 [Mortierella alpina]
MLSERLEELDAEEHRCSKPSRRLQQHDEFEARNCGPKEPVKADLWTWITSSNTSNSQEPCIVARDWAMVSVITAVTLGVRLWGISWPDEAAMDEAAVGKIVNAYLKGEFAFDAQPPLGKLILAAVASVAGYNGSYTFDQADDPYPWSVPYGSMRATMASMGALCSPMAYMTLKATGHSTLAAMLAATLVAFDNALTANNRRILLDAPLMFFTAATFMSWTLFAKGSSRPFALGWWAWLLATGVFMAGAVSVKLTGILTAAFVALFMLQDLWGLARKDSITADIWSKHCAARIGALLVLPLVLYLVIFRIHFSYQTREPDYLHSAQAEIDLRLLSPPFRHALVSRYPKEQEEAWRDVVYGSVVQLQSESQSQSYLHSFYKLNPGGSHQQQVGGYEYPDLNTHWIVILADIDKDEPEEIPSRLQYLKNGDYIRLRHVSTRRCLHAHDVRTYTSPQGKNLHEVSAYGGAGFDGDANDWWQVEEVDTDRMRETVDRDEGEPIKALETAFRLRHSSLGCYLYVSETTLPEPWGQGRREIVCRSDAGVTPKSIWRFTMNEHDYLPADALLAASPTPSFWQKFKYMHRLMWFPANRMESGVAPKVFDRLATRPQQWLLARSIVPVWAGYMRQVVVIANPVVWWVSTLGLLSFIAIKVTFVLRTKRGYLETGLLKKFKTEKLGNASTFFTAWAIHYVPFFCVDQTLYLHHYFPSLYCAILLASSLFSGLMDFIPRQVRFLCLFSLVILCTSSFTQLAPLTYGSLMTREHCESVSKWFSLLDCSISPELDTQHLPLLTLKKQRRKEKELWSMALQQKGSQTAKQSQATNEPILSHAGPDVDFLTKEAILPVSTSILSQDLQRGIDEFYTSYRHASTGKLELRKKSPVLEPFFPSADEPQPMQNVVLLPYQQSPQHWDLDVLNQMLGRWRGEHALQQVQDLIRKRHQHDERQQQQQQQQQERLVKDGEAGSLQDDVDIHDIAPKEPPASMSVDTPPPPPPSHTQGMAYPAAYEGRPDYQRREQMIAAAAIFAANKKAQVRAERDMLLALFPTKEKLAEHKAKEKEEMSRKLQKHREDMASYKDRNKSKV